jgi:hypothetical protein
VVIGVIVIVVAGVEDIVVDIDVVADVIVGVDVVVLLWAVEEVGLHPINHVKAMMQDT